MAETGTEVQRPPQQLASQPQRLGTYNALKLKSRKILIIRCDFWPFMRLRIPKGAALSPRDLAEDQGYLNNYWATNEKLIGIGTGGRRPIDCRIVLRL